MAVASAVRSHAEQCADATSPLSVTCQSRKVLARREDRTFDLNTYMVSTANVQLHRRRHAAGVTDAQVGWRCSKRENGAMGHCRKARGRARPCYEGCPCVTAAEGEFPGRTGC